MQVLASPLQHFLQPEQAELKLFQSVTKLKQQQRQQMFNMLTSQIPLKVSAAINKAQLIQWSLSIADTFGTQLSVLYREVSLIQR